MSKKHRIFITVSIALTLFVAGVFYLNKSRGPGSYIGLTEAEATKRAEERGYGVRILRKDNESFSHTDDIQRDRINFEIDNGIVTNTELY